MRFIMLMAIKLIVLACLFGVSTMSYAQSITQESELEEAFKTRIAEHWETGTFSSFQGKANVRINYASFTDTKHQQCIVIVPGRTEGYLKYKELSFDLYNQGYDIHIIDHRGQGISERIADNPHKGFVHQFDDYSEDLNTFIQTVTEQQCQKTYLLAHSMGGAITARYLQLFPHEIAAVVLASPMIAINSGGMPDWLGKFIIGSGSTINHWVSDQPWYFLGQGDYQPSPFEGNGITQSDVRYNIISTLYDNNTDIQLGGVTFPWLAQALKANEDIFRDIEKITPPLLVLQSGADPIVDNGAQDEFCKQLHQKQTQSCPDGKPVVIKDALHELFFEQDQYRQPAIERVLSWFKAH